MCGPGSGHPCPQALATLLQETIGELEAAQALVLKRIQIWKRQQQLAGNGAPFEESLAPLQERLGQGWRGRGAGATHLLSLQENPRV